MDRFRKTALEADYVLAEGGSRLNLLSSIDDAPGAAKLLHGKAADWIVDEARRPFVVEVAQRAYRQQTHEGRLLIHFSLSGEPWFLQWEPLSSLGIGLPFPEATSRELQLTGRVLLRESERLSEVMEEGSVSGGNYLISLIRDNSPSQYLFLQASGSLVRGVRGIGTWEQAVKKKDALAEFFRNLGVDLLFLIIASWLVVLSLLRGQLRLATGFAAGTAVLVTSLLSITPLLASPVYPVALFLGVLQTVLCCLLWIGAESVLGSYSESLVRGVDEIQFRHVTREFGLEILTGIGYGLCVAAITLAIAAFAYRTGWLWPRVSSIFLQNERYSENFVGNGVYFGAVVMLSDALSRRIAPIRSSCVYSCFISALLLGIYSRWGPVTLGTLAALPVAVSMVILLRRWGIAALLSGSLTASLAPPFVVALRYPEWLPVPVFVGVFWISSIAAMAFWSLRSRRVRQPPEERARPVVFIGYASEDELGAKRLYNELRRRGFEVWRDKEDLGPGYEWEPEICRAILRRANVAILCLSQRAVTKIGYLQREMRMAINVADEHPEGWMFLIPARLEKCVVPESLRRFQYIDLFKRGSYKLLAETIWAEWGRR